MDGIGSGTGSGTGLGLLDFGKGTVGPIGAFSGMLERPSRPREASAGAGD